MAAISPWPLSMLNITYKHDTVNNNDQHWPALTSADQHLEYDTVNQHWPALTRTDQQWPAVTNTNQGERWRWWWWLSSSRASSTRLLTSGSQGWRHVFVPVDSTLNSWLIEITVCLLNAFVFTRTLFRANFEFKGKHISICQKQLL